MHVLIDPERDVVTEWARGVTTGGWRLHTAILTAKGMVYAIYERPVT